MVYSGCLVKMGLDEVRDIIEYNKVIHNCESSGDKRKSSPVYSSDCLDSELRKIVLYNIRYDHEKNTRSDIDILDEYNYLLKSMDEIKETIDKLSHDLDDLENPSTLERLARTVITWTWSDNPRKSRIEVKKEIRNHIKDHKNVLEDIEFQIPLYKSVISVTTTTTIKTKATKLKSKYVNKIKSRK